MFIVGCEKETDKVIGSWKTEKEIYHGDYSKISTLIIEESTISFNGEKKFPIRLVFVPENGDIRVEKKYDNGLYCIITADGESRIKISETGSSRDGVYVRTTPEDVEAIIKSPGTKTVYKSWKPF